MSSHLHDARFSPAGLTAAVGAHVTIIAAAWMFAMHPPQLEPAILMAQLIVPEAPPAPSAEPPRPKPVVPPTPVREKVQPRPAPAPTARAPQMIASRAAESAAAMEAPRVQEAAPAPSQPAAPVSAPVEPAPRAAPAPTVTEPRFDAAYLDNPEPSYPPLSRRMREEGKVTLRVFVEPDGRPSQVMVKESSGSPRLDRAAEESVVRWKFVPARRGEEAVGAWVLVPIVFSLRG